MYTKQSWSDGSAGATPLSAARMQHMEDGIYDADTSTLTPTGVKTGNYTAVPGDLVPFDTGSGARVLTLPSTPPDKTRVAAKVTLGTVGAGGILANALTIQAGGTDVFNKTGGVTTLTVNTLNQLAELQYAAGGGIWYVLDDSLAVAALQAMFVSATAPVFASGAIADFSSAGGTSTTTGTTTGDKLSLYSTYGFGVQTNRLVAYVPSGSAWTLRASAGSGNRSSGTDAFAVDTNGHILIGAPTTAPTAAAGANAGTSPPAPVVAAASKDTRGSATFGTGTGAPAAGAQLVVTFNQAFAAAPFVQISETTGATVALSPYVSAVSTTGFTVSFNSAPPVSQANTVYGISWQAIG